MTVTSQVFTVLSRFEFKFLVNVNIFVQYLVFNAKLNVIQYIAMLYQKTNFYKLEYFTLT